MGLLQRNMRAEVGRMPKKQNASIAWAEVKKQLKSFDEHQVFDLIKGLYELSPENKRFVGARLGQADGESLDAYKREIAECLNPPIDDPIDLRRGRKAISSYKKAVPKDLEGCLDLMLVYVESGNSFTMDYGDIDEPFYDSLCSMMSSIQKLAPKVGIEAHADCAKRLKVMDEMPDIGWGYSDWLADVTDAVETSLQQRKS